MGLETATHQCLDRKPLGWANLCSFDAARLFDSECTERREASSRVDLLHYIFILAASNHAQPGCRAIAMKKRKEKSRCATIAGHGAEHAETPTGPQQRSTPNDHKFVLHTLRRRGMQVGSQGHSPLAPMWRLGPPTHDFFHTALFPVAKRFVKRCVWGYRCLLRCSSTPPSTRTHCVVAPSWLCTSRVRWRWGDG